MDLTRSSEWLRFTRLPTFIVLQTIQRWKCVCVRSALGPANSLLNKQCPTGILKVIPVKIIIYFCGLIISENSILMHFYDTLYHAL